MGLNEHTMRASSSVDERRASLENHEVLEEHEVVVLVWCVGLGVLWTVGATIEVFTWPVLQGVTIGSILGMLVFWPALLVIQGKLFLDAASISTSIWWLAIAVGVVIGLLGGGVLVVRALRRWGA